MTAKGNTYRRRRAARKRKLSPKAALLGIAVIMLCYGVACALDSYIPRRKATEALTGYDAAALSLVTLPAETPQIMKDYEGFTVSFNPECHQPNYVAWELTATEADGELPRSSKFKADRQMPGCATLDDYRNSGFDRGHMAPAADMKWSEQAMADCHYLTNICPQDRKLNGGRWATLEGRCREWARRDSAIIIIAGPVLNDIMTRTIGPSEVPVPERFFKIILSPYVNPPRAIAFIMPNSPEVDPLEKLTVSVDQVEQITGFDFFSALPDSIEDAVERQYNFRDFDRKNK